MRLTSSQTRKGLQGGRVRPWILFALGIVFVVVVGLKWWTGRTQRYETIETQKALISILQQQKALLSGARVPWDYDAGLFISKNALQAFLDGFKDFNLALGSYATLLVRQATVALEPGAPKIHLTIDVKPLVVTAKPFTVEATALLLLASTRTDEKGASYAGFRAAMLNISGPERDHLVDALVSAGAIKTIGQAIAFEIPIARRDPLVLLDGKEQTVPVNDGHGKIVYQLSKVQVDLDWHLLVPVFTKNGIWLLGELSTATPAAAQAPLLEADQAHLLEQSQKLIADVGALEKNAFFPDHDISFWVGSKILSKFASKTIADHPQVDAKLVSVSDFVYQSGDVLYVSLKDANGHVNLMPPITSWDDTRGFYLAVSATATAKVKLDIAARTKLGSVTLPAEIDGSAHDDSALAGWLLPEVVTSSSGSAFLLGANLECRAITAHFEGGGSIKYDARTSFYVNQKRLGASILMDSVPTYSIIGGKGENTSALELTFQPEEATIKERGFLLSSKIAARVTSAIPPESELEQRHDAIKKFADDTVASRPAPDCPGLPYTEVTIAGQPFGPNNYFLQNLVAVADAAQNGVKTIALPVTVGDDIVHGRPPSAIVHDVTSTVGSTLQSVGNAAKKLLGIK